MNFTLKANRYNLQHPGWCGMMPPPVNRLPKPSKTDGAAYQSLERMWKGSGSIDGPHMVFPKASKQEFRKLFPLIYFSISEISLKLQITYINIKRHIKPFLWESRAPVMNRFCKSLLLLSGLLAVVGSFAYKTTKFLGPYEP